MRCTFFLIALFYLTTLFAQSSVDSAKKIAGTQFAEKPVYTATCFFVADAYMDEEQYDSAQIWLNKIHAVLPAKENSLFNYFLITRQAEVYYYNNLQQLGLQESRRGLAMAKALNDSLLLADSYNFLGLFYMNIDSAELAITFYNQGLPYAKQPPYPLQYLSLSKPHHLYGNMAEAYFKLKQYDNALRNNYLSLSKATEINWERGIAVAYSGLGDVYSAIQKNDSAIVNYKKSIAAAINSADIDVALVGYGGLAKSNFANKSELAINDALQLGFSLLEKNPNINRFYALNFLSNAIAIYKAQNNTAGLIRTLEAKSEIEKANIDGNNKQIQTILNAGMVNETQILNLQIEEARQKQKLANTRLLLSLIVLALVAAGFLVYRYYQNQKNAAAKIRQHISQDLHDDIGASLSSLQIYGTIAEQSVNSNPGKAVEMLQKINKQSKEVLENMSDIVWSMRTNNTGGTTLETKVKNYAAELLQDKQIDFSFIIQAEAEAALQNMKARRNILLIIREVLNNAVKYSKASVFTLHIYLQDKSWAMEIADNGIGINMDKQYDGNGLKNIQQRCAELKGVCDIEGKEGARFMFVFPITIITDTGW
jgi:signal transduction histidine kinase